jgi:molybdopterin-guanine dinucleotide biosynthesis protein
VTLEELLRPHTTVTVVGLAKNAGKTTVVNHVLQRMEGRVGLASLGLDGEARDQLTGLAKPRIAPPAGALVLTTAHLRGQTPVVRALPFRTAAGEVVIVAAAGGEAVVVSGPTRLDELDDALAELRSAGAERLLLEGALGRLGTAAPGRADAVVLAAGASLAEGGDDLPLRLRLAVDALDLPVSDASADVVLDRAAGFEAEAAAEVRGGVVAELGGALTDPLLEALMREGLRATLVVADATRVLAGARTVARARRAGVELAARRPLRIVALTSSPFHPDAARTPREAFDALVGASAGRWPVYDVVAGFAA